MRRHRIDSNGSLATLRQRLVGCVRANPELFEDFERLKERQRTYQFSDQQILRGFPELLRGDAQLWYRNCATTITSLEELEGSLRAFYLSPGELRHFDRQIYDHHQGPRETIRVSTLQTLMRRRGGFTAERAIETLYYNVRPGLHLYIRLSEISCPNDLIQRVEDVEEIQRPTAGQLGIASNPERWSP